MDFIKAIQDAYHKSAGPDELLITAQNLYDTLESGDVRVVSDWFGTGVQDPEQGARSEGDYKVSDFSNDLQEFNEDTEGTEVKEFNEGTEVKEFNEGTEVKEFNEGTEVKEFNEVTDIKEIDTDLTIDGNDPKQIALQLIILEINLYFLPQTPKSESMLKSLAVLSPTNMANPQITPLMRLKYQDLVTDYQFLLSPNIKYLRLMDLVAKKINALTLAQGSNAVVANVQLKVLVYYLLGDWDFRDKSISKYLASFRTNSLSENTADCIDGTIDRFMACKDRLVPYECFWGLVQYGQQLYSFRTVFQKFQDQLTENHLDSNLSKLPRYYTSVRLQRIKTLFLHDSSDTDVEAVICRMIINNKLPPGTIIDQITSMVYFGDFTEHYDDMNTHVKKICDIVERVSS